MSRVDLDNLELYPRGALYPWGRGISRRRRIHGRTICRVRGGWELRP